VNVRQFARIAWRQGWIPVRPFARSLGSDMVRSAFPRLRQGAGADVEFLRSSERTFKESRAVLARIQRGAYAVVASSAILSPILIAALSVISHHLHAHDRLWLLALSVAALSALAFIAAALSAVRCLMLSGLAAPSMPLAVRSQKLRGTTADMTRAGEVLLERAEENRQRTARGIGPLVVAQRSLAFGILTLVAAGIMVLVAEAF
jgi:hypothetical protein